MTTVEVPANGLVFNAMVAGPKEGRPVLLLHGFPQSSWSWRFLLEGLGDAGNRALAPDLRGYSPLARPKGVDAYRLPHLVDDVVAFARWMGTDRVDLIGHDWGGALAWQVASRHPDLVSTLTVVSTPHPQAFAGARSDPEADQAQRSSYMQFFTRPEEPERLLLADQGSGLRAMFARSGLKTAQADQRKDDPLVRYVDLLLQPGAMTAALNWYRAASRTDLEGMGPVLAPTLYVWSTEDVALGREAAEATGAFVDGDYRFVVLEGVSHWVPEEAPEDLCRLVLEHLDAHERV